MSESLPTARLVRRLLLVVAAMFAFGFALVPIYDVMCQAFGINGKRSMSELFMSHPPIEQRIAALRG